MSAPDAGQQAHPARERGGRTPKQPGCESQAASGRMRPRSASPAGRLHRDPASRRRTLHGRRHRASRRVRARIGSINAVYFEIEIGIVTLRADAKERLASTTAGDVEFAMEIREPRWSAGSFEGFVRETWWPRGPAGVSDTAPGVRPASHPCVREGCAVSLVPLGPAILVAAALGRRV